MCIVSYALLGLHILLLVLNVYSILFYLLLGSSRLKKSGYVSEKFSDIWPFRLFQFKLFSFLYVINIVMCDLFYGYVLPLFFFIEYLTTMILDIMFKNFCAYKVGFLELNISETEIISTVLLGNKLLKVTLLILIKFYTILWWCLLQCKHIILFFLRFLRNIEYFNPLKILSVLPQINN